MCKCDQPLYNYPAAKTGPPEIHCSLCSRVAPSEVQAIASSMFRLGEQVGIQKTYRRIMQMLGMEGQ